MATLTQQQKEYLMKQSVGTIRDKYIATGHIKFPDDLIEYKDTPKFKAIAESLASIPDPAAAARWAEVEAAVANASPDEGATMLRAYLAQYEANPSAKGFVEKASAMLSALTADVESADWEAVDFDSPGSLLAHRRKYPSTVHETEIDNRVWELTDRSNPSEVARYKASFPSGLHRAECDAIADAQQLWQGVSTDPDLITLNDYITEEVSSPFAADALRLFEETKLGEIREMLANPGTYDTAFLKTLMKEKIFSREELIRCGACSEKSLNYLEHPEELPSIEQNGDNDPAIHEGATDIFLFGIPSSGKTCVLMGLLGAPQFDYNNALEGHGGAYADSLKIYRRYGKAPGRTYGNFVTQIPGAIYPAGTDIKYPVNLIEMSGEEFAMKIAYNAENTVNFEDMGTGASKLLSSANRKVIFIVIDPTADGLIKISTQADDGSTQVRTVQQDIVISKIVNMLERNRKVLQRTNAIHFILTKSDTLGDDAAERDAEAFQRVSDLYSNTINRLTEICKANSINFTAKAKDGAPMLFTFSLGRFYVGDYFEYDVTDANKIMEYIPSMCQGQKAGGFLRKA